MSRRTRGRGPVPLLARLIAVVVLLACAACTQPAPPAPAPPPTLPTPAPHDRPAADLATAFPRTAVTWLDQDAVPSVDQLARYDLVIIDSEWGHRLDRSWFADLRTRNPDIVLLAYVNLVDYPPELGTSDYYADRYALWRYTGPTTSTFPEQWLARTADGESVSEWPNTVMTNLADTDPPVDGQNFGDHAARTVVDQIWSTGLWDGIYLDVWTDTIYDATRDSWDVDGDGTDDAASAIYGPGNPWERGLTRVEQILRAAMPGAVLIGNGDRTLRDGLLDGRAFESFADAKADRDPTRDISDYLRESASDGHRGPGAMLTINRRRADEGSPESFRDARFFLTATLLQDGYWAPMGTDYGQLASYDETDGGGLGPGYLGGPAVADPTPAAVAAPFSGGIGTVAPGVVRRDFDHGVVLNNSGTAAQTVDLGGTFQHLRGRQDPAVNNGEQVTSVTVPPGDGVILLRAGS